MKLTKHLLAIAITAALTGCSAEQQDVPSTNMLANNAASGLVIDPNITGAVVFADYNNDGVLDAFEPWALTDENGYYGTSADGEDYCQTNLDYCLQLPNDQPVTLYAVGGYDTVTLEKVKTRLSRTYNGGDNQLISPLTSLGEMAISDQQSIEREQNFLTEGFQQSEATKAFQLAFSINKVVENIAAQLAKEYPALGDHEDLPSDASGYIYQALRQIGESQQMSIESFLTTLSPALMAELLDTARNEIELAHQQADVFFELTDTSQVDVRLTDAVTVINKIATELFSTENQQNQLGVVRAVQAVANMAQTDVQAAALAATKLGQDDFIEAMEQEEYDSSILYSYLLNSDSLDSLLPQDLINARLSLPGSLADHQLTLKKNTSNKVAAVSLFFAGNGNKGELKACLVYQDLRDPNSTKNTAGALLSGSWRRLNNYNIIIELELAGAKETSRVKKNTETSFTFDYDGDEKEWQSEQGLSLTEFDLPTTDLACQTWFE